MLQPQISSDLVGLASLPSPLPPVPEGEVYTTDQWATLVAICEVFVPSLGPSHSADNSVLALTAPEEDVASKLRTYLPEGADPRLIEEYLAESITSHPEYKDTVQRKFRQFVPLSEVQGLGFILSALDTRAGCLVLTGSTTPLRNQNLVTRTRIVANWAQSYLKPLRTLFRSLSALSKQIWIALSPIVPKLLDFPDIPKHVERNPGFDFRFHDFADPNKTTHLTTDVVIIGSGCGAGVIASHLSRSGLKCLLLEKSYHFPSTHFPMSQNAAGTHLMENGGVIVSDDGSTAVVAGSTWGGGGTVNWSASLQPQHFVREEWADQGLPMFTGREFQNCLDTVCDRMGVARPYDTDALSKIEHNFTNKTLLEGSRKMGIAAEIVPQNTASKRHFCGYCSSGCASSTKQGPANCWLPDAATHGAEFIEGCFVDKILFDTSDPRIATGVAATWQSRSRDVSRSITISASRVIVAAGTLQSPLLLTRSGLRNPNIGKNLHLHPTSWVWAAWPHRVNPWEGSILTAAVTGLENLDGLGHGPKLEALCSTPVWANAVMPWRAKLSHPADIAGAALDYKLTVAKHGYSTTFISLQRDQDSGSVYADANDPRMVRVKYSPSARDRDGILKGQILGARIAFIQGAVEIDTMHPEGKRFVRPSFAGKQERDARYHDLKDKSEVTDAILKERISEEEEDEDNRAFEDYLTEVKRLGLISPEPNIFGSAHQMGTCRMSSTPATGVVDSKGKVWNTENVYVADTSVFPSATGVNPMVTVMGIAEFIARNIVKEVGRESGD